MYLNIQLNKEELQTIENGGFITLLSGDGIRIIVKKDSDTEVNADEQRRI